MRGCRLPLLSTNSFAEESLSGFTTPHLSVIGIISQATGILFRKSLLIYLYLRDPLFSSEDFRVSGLAL